MSRFIDAKLYSKVYVQIENKIWNFILKFTKLIPKYNEQTLKKQQMSIHFLCKIFRRSP